MEQWFEECGCGLELLTGGLQDAGQQHTAAMPANTLCVRVLLGAVTAAQSQNDWLS